MTKFYQKGKGQKQKGGSVFGKAWKQYRKVYQKGKGLKQNGGMVDQG
jgi:hypothetical protein